MIDEDIAMPAFSPDLRAMVFKLKKEIEKKRSKNYEKIREAKIKLEKKPHNRGAQEKIRKAEEENVLLNEVEREIRRLATSTQQYDLVTNYSFKSGTDVEYRGGFDYNPVTKHAEIRVSSSNPSLGTFAHELKHAYQFETGTLSGLSNKIDGVAFALYDKEDEREAFARGRLFGLYETFERNAAVYDHIPDSRDFDETIRKSKTAEVHKWKNWSATVVSPDVLHRYELILRDPHATSKEKEDAEKELMSISFKTHTAFRINGKTYYNGRIIKNKR
jgi:hypothetical protein